MAARAAMLLVAAWLVLAAIGVIGVIDDTATDLPPSAQRLAVTAVLAGLAPLFWPGNAVTPMRTALRIAAWSAAVACLAAILLQTLGNAAQPAGRILASCAMLMLILLLTHAVAAGIEARLRGQSGQAQNAREMSGRMVAIALTVLGSLPLWLGPVAELLAKRHAWIIDAALGISPLTHLAVASENDLLRNQWFYQHANLAALQFSYPSVAELALGYASVGCVLALIALIPLIPLMLRRRQRPAAGATRICSIPEKTP